MSDFLTTVVIVLVFVGLLVLINSFLPADAPVTGTLAPEVTPSPPVTGTPTPTQRVAPVYYRAVTGTPTARMATVRTGVENGSLNFRISENGRVLYTIPEGARVQIIRSSPGGWSYVRDGGAFGYVWDAFLVEDAP